MKTWITELIDRFYFPFLRKRFTPEFFRYAACGGLNMVLDWSLYAVFYNFIFQKRNVDLGIVVISPYIAAFLVVFPITFFTGFWFNRNIAFSGSDLRGRTQLFRYLQVVGVSVLINYFGLKFFVEVVRIYPTPSKILVTFITVIFSYFSQRHYSFRKRRKASGKSPGKAPVPTEEMSEDSEPQPCNTNELTTP